MQIKNKKADKPYSVTYRVWRTEYLANDKHKHFEILNYNNVVELHVIDKITGELKFSQVIDKNEAENNVRQFSTTQYIKPLSFEYYDKNLIPIKKTDYSGLSFFKRIKAKIQQIISPKTNPNAIPFSRFEKWSLILMALAVIVPICIYIITEFNN
ncbi:hypothetical protein [Hanstruepera marina]|uniref:hypothetical protein n=1 Tax=Hanstruepera marina TaxID=2873265 RepID=UPI001CA78ED8|nr:hypothetical protein [Hanstruepera marina]